MKKSSEASNHFSVVVILILFFFLPGCTPKTKEGALPEKLLETFIIEKYGVNPNQPGDTVMYSFNHRVYLPELELEMIFPIIPGGHSEPCIIFFDQKNMRFYHKCNSGGYGGSGCLYPFYYQCLWLHVLLRCGHSRLPPAHPAAHHPPRLPERQPNTH